MTDAFTHMNLHPQVMQAIAELGYTTPTPVQEAVIPLMLNGQDVVGEAQTGTGKTAAFSLPILQALTPGQRNIQSLIITPTRELALQVAQAIESYGHYRGVRVLPIYGGQPYNQQVHQLKKGVDIVVGTPGRLLDLMQQKLLDLSHIRTLVIDEADEMLSLGFIDDLEAILHGLPSKRQTGLFSATMPPEVRRLADRYMHQAQAVTMRQPQRTVATVEQRYYVVNEVDKLAALTRLFEVEDITSALIFARTRARTGELANALITRGFLAEALHGDLSQEAREQVLQRFRASQVKVLVATDVAARGLDIDDISHVFNYDLPLEPEVYVHRVGRTARAGKTGMALSLLTPKEVWRLRRIEAYTKQKMTAAALPTAEDIQGRWEAQLLERLLVWLKRGRCSREREIVSQLANEGHTPMDIAAAALKLARAEEKQRPIAPLSEVQPVAEPPSRRERMRGQRGYVRHRSPQGRGHGMRPLTRSAGARRRERPAHAAETRG